MFISGNTSQRPAVEAINGAPNLNPAVNPSGWAIRQAARNRNSLEQLAANAGIECSRTWTATGNHRIFLDVSSTEQLTALLKRFENMPNVLHLLILTSGDDLKSVKHLLAIFRGTPIHDVPLNVINAEYPRGLHGKLDPKTGLRHVNRLAKWGLHPERAHIQAVMIQLAPNESDNLDSRLTEGFADQGEFPNFKANPNDIHQATIVLEAEKYLKAKPGSRVNAMGANPRVQDCTRTWTGTPIGTSGEWLLDLVGLDRTRHGRFTGGSFVQDLRLYANDRIIGSWRANVG